MANVGALVISIRADTGKLGKDLAPVSKVINAKLAPLGPRGSARNPVMASLVDTFSEGATKVDRYGTALKKVLNNAGARQFAGLADAIGDAGEMFASFGVIGGGAIIGVAAGIGAVVAGFVAIQRVASQAMSAVDAAFKLGDKSKTLEALREIIKGGAGAGIKITLADTQAVQAVNQEFTKLGNAVTALGVQIVSDFQPEIIGLLRGATQVVTVFAEAAKIAKEYADIWARRVNAVAPEGSARRGLLSGFFNAGLLGSGTAADSAVSSRMSNDKLLASFASGKLGGSVASRLDSPGAFEAFSAQAASASIQARNAYAGDPADHSKDGVKDAIEENNKKQDLANSLLSAILSSLTKGARQQVVGI